MDFERILGVPFFHSSFHSIMLWMPELYCEYLVLQNWTFYTGKRQTKDAKTKLNNPRRQKWRQVLSVKVNPQAPAPLHKIWWCHDPLTQRNRKQYLVSLPRNKIMHCKLVKAMNFSNCDYWSCLNFDDLKFAGCCQQTFKYKEFVANSQQCFSLMPQANLSIIWIFTEGGGIESRLPFKIFSTLKTTDEPQNFERGHTVILEYFNIKE